MDKFKYVGQDDWSRDLYQSVKTGIVYVEVDGMLYTRTSDWGEPCTPLRTLGNVEVVK
jgi:hypothetical protein